MFLGAIDSGNRRVVVEFVGPDRFIGKSITRGQWRERIGNVCWCTVQLSEGRFKHCFDAMDRILREYLRR